MASNSRAPPAKDYEKFCYQYYTNTICPLSTNCNYHHKSNFEVELVSYAKDSDYFIGKLIQYQPGSIFPCRFYKSGRCRFQDTCRFLHDGANNNTVVASNSSQGRSSDHNGEETDHVVDEINSNVVATTDPQFPDEEEGACARPFTHRNWADAPEFVPRSAASKSYAQAVSAADAQGTTSSSSSSANQRLCPHTSKEGVCVNAGTCHYLHGEFCDFCERYVLHPTNEQARKNHIHECINQHERDMELSFAVQRSKDKACGVCFEIIVEKAVGEQRFGILPNCNHCFCLDCIRKWRKARQFENKIIRACPECRITSDFVCPSMYWVDTKEDKDKLIDDYKNALARKNCKYFNQGKGNCPFGNKCFYLHVDGDGKKVDVGPPQRQRRHRDSDHQQDMDVLQVMLWDFLGERDFPWQSLADDLEDLVSFFTDSEESDWSDYELFLD